MLIHLDKNNNITIITKSSSFYYEIKKECDNIHFTFGRKSFPSDAELETKINPEFRIRKTSYKLFFGKYTHCITVHAKLRKSICCGSVPDMYFIYDPTLDDFILKRTGAEAAKFSKVIDSRIQDYINNKIKEMEQTRKEIENRNKNSFERKFNKNKSTDELQIMVEKVPTGALLEFQGVVVEELVRRNSGEAMKKSPQHRRQPSKDDLFIK